MFHGSANQVKTVTGDVKMSEIAEVELTHRRMVASSFREG